MTLNPDRKTRDQASKNQISPTFELAFDESRLSSLIFSYLDPKPNQECSITSLRNMLTTLKLKHPESWKDILAKMIFQVPNATNSSYSSLFTGTSLTKSFPPLSLPSDPEASVLILSSHLSHPEFISKIQELFRKTNPEVLFAKFADKSPEIFTKFVSLYYLFDAASLIDSFQKYTDEHFGGQTVEYAVQYLNSYEKLLKIIPNGKLLHIVYMKIGALLAGVKGAKSLAEYFDVCLSAQVLSTHCSILYMLCQQKDQFEKFHLELCIKRLLKVFSSQFELDFCEKIKENAGPDAMESVTSMINSAKEHQIQVEKMNILITTQRQLSFASYPIQTLSDLTPEFIPDPLNSMLADYQKMFKQTFAHKTLNFFHLSGILELQYGTTSLTCNFVQACVLLLFNLKKLYKSEEIVERLPGNAGWKEMVLEEIQGLKLVFKHTHLGLEINLKENFLLDLTRKDQNELEEEQGMEEIRKPHIDCLVVRLLKTNKQVDIPEIKEKLKAGLKFIPTDSLIEERLKNLESRGFLWRVENTCGYIP